MTFFYVDIDFFLILGAFHIDIYLCQMLDIKGCYEQMIPY